MQKLKTILYTVGSILIGILFFIFTGKFGNKKSKIKTLSKDITERAKRIQGVSEELQDTIRSSRKIIDQSKSEQRTRNKQSRKLNDEFTELDARASETDKQIDELL